MSSSFLITGSLLDVDVDWLMLAQLERGLKLYAKKGVLSPLQRITCLSVVWDSTTMQARLSPARFESILTTVKRVKKGRSLTAKQTAGSDGGCVQLGYFGLLYMRPLQWWLKPKGFSLRGNPLCMLKITLCCLRALHVWMKPWLLRCLGSWPLALTHPSPVGEQSWVAFQPAVCGVVVISCGTSTAWRCWPCF